TVTGMDRTASEEAARELGELFPAVYLALHRRDDKRRPLAGASRAVLQHLTLTGPLRVGELARHLGRAQSVASEIVNHLQRDGLLERQRDPEDGRRTLVWLSRAGLSRLDEDRQVLSPRLSAETLARMPGGDVAALLRGLRALVAAAPPTLQQRQPRTGDRNPNAGGPHDRHPGL
ncbi:MAG TPA: MarR family winged helix-turn-helix transcriptional regulator, partial [Polyangia bacterium]|nr:MarR family winged helix-turn-helix transcriptional regulator [Polyangia bacterium]